jgi:phenylpyruvate tautomerase PptA (4-oxalocrotonate tautomerase family)
MPLIHIKSLPFEQELDIPLIIEMVSRDLSQQLDIPAEHITVTWEYLQIGHYAHNNKVCDHQPNASHPVLIDLLAPDFHSEATIGKMLRHIAVSISKHTNISDSNIFINCRCAHSGRVFDNGEIVHW